MNFFIIYVFLLFLIFIPNFIIKLPFLKHYNIQIFFLGLLFTFLIGLGHEFLLDQKQGFVIEMKSKEGENPLAKLMASFINSKTPGKTKETNYQINNNIDLSDPNLTMDDGELQILKKEIIENNMNKQMKKENQEKNENMGWVLSPIVQERKYERTKQKGLYCAADFNSTTTCCGQPPSDVPEEYICPENTPKCKNYIANEKWGICSN